MTTLTAPEDSRAPAATAPGAPRLRLRRAGRVEQTYQLEPGKWTIGSSPRCQVRLPATEAQPLQCLITLERGAAIVTRWAAGVLLNGRDFSKKPLQSGDRLSIGPWEIEWDDRVEAETPFADDRSWVTEPLPPIASFSATSPPEAAPTIAPESDETSTLSPAAPEEDAAEWVEQAESLEAPPAVAPADAPARLTTPLAPLEPLLAPHVPALTTGSAPRPTPSPRPAAKTVLVASRKTDPCDQPLGPMAPASNTLIQAQLAPREVHRSETFQDRLVVKLWAANFAARSRTKALAANAHAARNRVDQLAAESAELASRLEEARALNDSLAADYRAEQEALCSKLTEATAECDRLVAELEAFRNISETESADLKRRHDALQRQFDQAGAERDRLIAEWDARTAASDARAAELNADHDALQTLLDEADAAREQFSAELQSLRASTDAQLAERQVQVDALQVALNEANAGKDQLLGELDAIQAQAAVDAKERTTQIETLQREYAGAVSQRDQLVGELEALRTARPKTAPPDPRLQTLADANAAGEVEAARLREQVAASEQQIVALQRKIEAEDAAHAGVDEQLAAYAAAELQWQTERDALLGQLREAEDEATRLRDELTACETHIERLEEQFSAAEAARVAVDQQLADQQRQQAQWLAECQTLQTSHAAALADVEQQRDMLHQRLDELASRPAPAAVEWRTPVEAETAAAQLDCTPELAVEPAPADEFSQPAWPAAGPEPIRPIALELVAPTALDAVDPAPTPEPAYAPTSFIDKYRHLLDNDVSTPEPSLRKSQPILDDEYLSPAQFDDTGHADNDSDEALEAYMSNMMRRVRSSGSNVVASMAPINFGPQHGEESVVQPAALADDAEAVEMEIDANGMQRAVRKNPTIATNLAALRDLANTSARTAIAQHRQRRHVESAIVKGAFFVVAAGAAAYLLLVAPGVESPWFWGGCVAMVAAGGAGAQLISLFWQRLADGRRYQYATAPSAVTDALAQLQAVQGEHAEPAAL